MNPIPSWPGRGRVTLVLLAVVPVALAYPWQSTRDYVLLGVAAAVVIGLFGFWRGLYFTTIARRGLAILRRRRRIAEPATCTRTTVLVWVGPPASDTNVLPLTLIARYLDRYGIRADTIRITSRVTASGDCRTWVRLTVVADDNLAALQARSARIPCKRPRRSRRAGSPTICAKSVGRLVRPHPTRSQRWWLRILARRGAECGTPTRITLRHIGSAPMPSCPIRCPRSGRVRRRRPGSRWRSHMPPGHQPATRWPLPAHCGPIGGLAAPHRWPACSRNTETTCQP